MKIAMLGTGYVGLVSGVCFSDFGHDVVCVDRMPGKIEMLERGEVPIYEPGLEAVMARRGGCRSAPPLPVRWTAPTLCSSPWARRRGAATGMPT